MTSPRTILPASVALSSTIAAGARPQRRKISSSPAHRHSDLCDMRATHCRSFECGSVATSSLRSRVLPPTAARKFPKSTWQVPGAHSSSRYPSPPAAARASLGSRTNLCTVEYEPP